MNFYWGSLIVAAVVFLGGIVLVLLLRRYGYWDVTAFLALFLTPLLVYGVASGAIREVGGAGVSAKFQDIAKAAVTPTPISTESVELLEKGDDLAQFRERAQRMLGRPAILTITLGSAYEAKNTIQNIELVVREIDRDMPAVIIERDQTFLAMTDVGKMLTALRNSQDLITAIASGNSQQLRAMNLPLVFEPLTAKSTNAEALKKMVEANLREMVVVDRKDKPTQLVKRDQIVAKLVSELVEPH